MKGFAKTFGFSVLLVLGTAFNTAAWSEENSAAIAGAIETSDATQSATSAEFNTELRRKDLSEEHKSTSVPDGQRSVVDAQDHGRGVNFLEVHEVVISEILREDTTGRPHQKWMVSLANGRNLLAVYNSDMGERIPLAVGQKVSMGGQYIWDRSGGLIHWLHRDPRGRRPNGWVEMNGVVYGK